MHKRCRFWLLAAVAGVGLMSAGSALSRAADPTDMQGGSDMAGTSQMQGQTDMAPEAAPVPAAPATQPAKTTAMADDDSPAAPRLRQRLSDALAKLNLTPDQRTGVRAVLEQARTDGQAMRQDLAGATPEERAQRVREFARNVMEKIEAQLAPDQVKTLRAAMAAGGATSQPAGLAQGPERGRLRAAAAAGDVAAGQNAPGYRLQRLRQNLDSLDLNEEQKAKVDAMLSDAQKKALAIPADAPDRIAQLQQIRQGIRGQLLDILEPDQLETLRSKMQEQGLLAGRGGERRPGAATQPAANASPAPDSHAQTSASTSTLAPPSDTTPAAGPIAVGQPAPPFRLESLDGSAFTSASLKGHVTALVFGSYSSPIFRDRAAGLEKLFRKLDDQDSSAKLLVVYTREAHPAGGWQIDRNKQDHISVSAAATDADRRAAARQCRSALHLTVPFLVDGIDDAATSAYGGFPDAAVVIGPDGKVAATQRWAEPSTLARQIQEASGKQATASIDP